jgi:AcrR family transcriptional regulator
MSTASTQSGRPRDPAIDTAVLDTARRHLAVHGLAGLSIAAVADEAGTTRPAVYRRWPTKLALAVAAVIDLAEVAPPQPTDDPFEDLVAELEHFRHCITDASALALAGVMLQDGVDPQFQKEYRDHLVKPRRARIRACLERGILEGHLDPEADLAVAGTFLTGSWYAFAIGGAPVPRDWARRVAALVWRACGGAAAGSGSR